MKKKGWSVLLIDSTSLVQSRRIYIPHIVAILLFLLCIGGLAGFGRCIYVVGHYAYSKLGVAGEQKKNSDLIKIVKFLQRRTKESSSEIEHLIAFEDKTRLEYGMNTIGEDIHKAGVGGPPKIEDMIMASLIDPKLVEANNIENEISQLFNQIGLQKKTFSRMEHYIFRQHDRWSQHPSIWPCVGRITSGYGYRIHPLFGYRAFHEGVDIANKTWTPIFATGDGIISFSGTKRDFGNVVKITHSGSGYETIYAHLKQASVVEGHPVKRGELIGYMGNTGRSTGPHLHYEVRNMGRHVNPMHYILPVETIVN
ncbi:MAG: peptidoglycan DD-metalloendopeptidase family protein [Chitinivibrionales bacterium]|nr:peptidoglycan DD-metalloendopeptidase family protein [Chitinivibrionales bacterium]